MGKSTNKKTSRFENMTEDEVILLAQNGDREAEEYLIKSNMDIVYSKSRLFYIKGLDKEDVIQEGLVGLYKAIRDYKVMREASFRGFAHLCVNRQLISAVKMANRQKHLPLNTSTSIDRNLKYTKDDGGRGRTLLDILPDENMDPERDLINKEMLEEITQELKKVLTPLEWKVFTSYLESKSYKEISEELDKTIKTVDNALQRSRRKIHQLRYKFENEVANY
ncbi:RNA polymerase subunit sigma-24 [Anoxybacter fermentans]|uniref:RNA polymerase subunit sigma-24 n=1 Tax=Anoxybacter fermentans TaxID=1323375 RepID=A0A3S9SZR8_9FIRM|nr:RNA polymerase sporulation sigma factor SigH [Anoxybacter fermentans]AZR73836.1 RNA polymerase subunit sigma-24 [Anoxybacter fermentans]